MIGVIFQLSSFLFLIMITFNYFSKARILSLETKIFSILIIVNLFGVVIDLTSTSMALFDISNPLLNIISKLYLVYVVTTAIVFIFYAINVSFDLTEKQHSFIIKSLAILLFTLFVLCMALPLYNYSQNGIVYTYGPASNIPKVFGMFSYVSIFSLIITRYKKQQSKKFLPLLAFIIFGLLAGIIQILYPQILILTFSFIYAIFFMSYTIENPDLKMIEQLNIATEQAERANMAKTDFLANMSHEIRTPLNAIVGFSQALAEEDIPLEAKEEVNDIIMSSNNLLEIVNGILDISKIEANKLEIVNVEYDSNRLIKELISLIKARLGSKPLDFRIQIDPSLPPVLYGDHTRLKQIAINILTNAVKYTKEGYISLTVSSFVQGDICRLIIAVEDSGIGIKPADVDKLFTKFQRFELERNITTEGTGLGLAITKSLVELMGGKIVVQSIYGEGTKFTISLDQRIVPKTADELNLEQEVDFTPFNASGQRILVVDDNKVNLKVAKRLLRDYHAEVVLVLSGQECIDLILNGDKFDLILMDDMMPRMTGTETLKHLKNIIGFNTPIAALTANAISGMRERYLSLGFDEYLAKPIDKDKLCVVLRKYLKENEEILANYDIEETQEIDVKTIKDEIIARNTDFLKINEIDLERGLELLGDMETYEMTLIDFYDESQSRFEQINSYKEKNDMLNYAILVHAMKSDSKYLGFTKLAELSLNHEMASKENRVQYVNEHYNELMDEVTRIITVVKKYLGK
jgi:Signal transduction histidine kinase